MERNKATAHINVSSSPPHSLITLVLSPSLFSLRLSSVVLTSAVKTTDDMMIKMELAQTTSSPIASPSIRRSKSSIHLPVQHFFLDLDEEDTNELSPLSKQCQDIWETVQLDCVWGPMVSALSFALLCPLSPVDHWQAFVYCYNALQVPNVAWRSYLILDLHFAPWALVRLPSVSLPLHPPSLLTSRSPLVAVGSHGCDGKLHDLRWCVRLQIFLLQELLEKDLSLVYHHHNLLFFPPTPPHLPGLPLLSSPLFPHMSLPRRGRSTQSIFTSVITSFLLEMMSSQLTSVASNSCRSPLPPCPSPHRGVDVYHVHEALS
jgi:hypothetical protein